MVFASYPLPGGNPRPRLARPPRLDHRGLAAGSEGLGNSREPDAGRVAGGGHIARPGLKLGGPPGSFARSGPAAERRQVGKVLDEPPQKKLTNVGWDRSRITIVVVLKPGDPIGSVVNDNEYRIGAAETVAIQLCGPLRVDIGGHRLDNQLPGRQGRALFAYLALNRSRAVRRDEAIDALWPARPPAAPDAALRTVLARLRRVLGARRVKGRDQLWLDLGDGATIDVEEAAAGAEEAERSLAEGNVDRASAAASASLEILERPLLPELDAPWVEEGRAALGEHEPRVLEVQAWSSLAAEPPDFGAAERAARRLVERHPFRESGHTVLMEAYARQGNVAEALRAFDRLRIFLMDELGTAPSAAVVGLHERLLRHGSLEERRPEPTPRELPTPRSVEVAPPTALAAADRAAFLGRDEELARLLVPWREAAAGERTLAMIVGEPGVGKTRLAARVAQEVREDAGLALYGRAEEDAVVPFQPFVEALRQYGDHVGWDIPAEYPESPGELARLIPELRRQADLPHTQSDRPELERFRLFEAVADVLAAASRPTPLLLILDDLHWADKPTLLLLRHLARHSAAARILMLVQLRAAELDGDHPLATVLADLRRDGPIVRVGLEGLDESATAQLVAARLGRPAAPGFARAISEWTEGNPFFIEEALRSLSETELDDSGEGPSERTLERVGIPEGVAEVLFRRLRRLPDGALECLTLGSVIGRDFDLGLIEDLQDRGAPSAIDAVESAVAAGLVVESTERLDRFSFRHALVREAIYRQLSASRRARLHKAVGEALERRENGARRDAVASGQIARHFHLARDLVEPEKVTMHAIRAGEHAAQALAYEEAVAHYQRAVDASVRAGATGSAAHCDLLLAFGRVQWQAGEDAARETFLAAARCDRSEIAPQQLALAALGLGQRYWEANVVDDTYRELLEEALAALPNEHAALKARVLARLAENLHFSGEGTRGMALSEEALAIARGLGERDTLVAALKGRHVALLHADYVEQRLALIDEMLTLARGHREISAEGHHLRLYDLFELSDLDEARRGQAQLEEFALELRQPLFRYVALGWRGVWAELEGRPEEAERLARESLELGERAHASDARSIFTAKLLMLRRDQGRIAELLPATEALARGPIPAWEAAHGWALLEAGEKESGRQVYERLTARGLGALPRDLNWLAAMAKLAEAAALLADVPRANEIYELLLPYAARNVQVTLSTCWGPVERQLALLAATVGRHEPAWGHLDRALERSHAMGAPVLAARTACDGGELLAVGADSRLRVLAGEVVDVADGLKLDWLAARGRALADRTA